MNKGIQLEQTKEIFSDLFSQLQVTLTNSIAPVLDGLPDQDADLLVAEALRNLTRMLASSQLNSIENDPLYPYLAKTISVQRRVVLPGADTVYHVAVLDGAHDYKIYGNRGSAHIFELEVWEGHVSDLMNFKYHSSLDAFSSAPNENLEIHLSQNSKEGDWIKLPEGECTVLVRQYYYDWENEQPALLDIQRIGAQLPPPPVKTADIVSRYQRMLDMIRTYPLAARHGVDQHLQAPMNEMTLAAVNIGFVKLRYLHGQYSCNEDEAIIIEVTPPEAKFWNFQLLNLQWEALEYHHRQCSVNGHQAQLDKAGVFRGVISHRDPGIKNWLDTSGRTFGLLSSRYYDPGSTPIPTLKKVPFESLTDYIPAEDFSVSAEQRQESLRQRSWSTVRRFCAD